MTERFRFQLLARDGLARRGEIFTPRGTIRTPAFMPVGTVATVKALYPEQVRDAGADILLGNTYHLMLRPGAERMARLGGLHKFMRWEKPILTDSGGFQVMSLSKIRKINEEGALFQSHLDGSRHMLTPERAIEIQCLLGSDIQMQLDECIELPSERREVERAMELSLRPDEKLQVVEAHRAAGRRPVFVGDGLNDAAALAAAHVGVAMGGGAAASARAAGVVILSDSLAPLLGAIQVAHVTRTVLRVTAITAITYNVLAVAAAMAGFVTPLFAAILMPLSSASVILQAMSIDRRARRRAERTHAEVPSP